MIRHNKQLMLLLLLASSASATTPNIRNTGGRNLQVEGPVMEQPPSTEDDVCMDGEYAIMFQDVEVTCESAKEQGFCAGDAVSEQVDVALVEQRDENSGLDLREACCACGGGEIFAANATEPVAGQVEETQAPDEDEQAGDTGGDTGSSGGTGEDENTQAPENGGGNNENQVNDTSTESACGKGQSLTLESNTAYLDGNLDESVSASFPNSINLPCMTGLEQGPEWYSVTGTGQIMSFTACSKGSLATSVAIRVFVDEQGNDKCENFKCADEAVRQYPSCDNGYAVSWLSKDNTKYHVLVAGMPIGSGGSEPSVSKRRHLQASRSQTPFQLLYNQVARSENHQCDVAIPLEKGQNIQGQTLGGQVTSTCDGEGSAATPSKPGVFYSLIQEGSGDRTLVYQANTCGSQTTFDGTISVFSGPCRKLKCKETEELSCPNGSPGRLIFWTAQEQEELFLMIHGSSQSPNQEYGGGGAFQFRVDVSQEVENDNCEQAKELVIGADPIEGTTRGARPDTVAGGASACGKEAFGVWYHVKGNGKHVKVSTCSSNTRHNTAIHVFTGTCGSLICMDTEAGNEAICKAENPDRSATVNFQAQDTIDYYILVSSTDDKTGSFDLSIMEIDPPDNDDCKNAFPLVIGEAKRDSTENAIADFPLGETCGVPLDTPGVWYSIVGNGQGMAISSCPTDGYSTTISVFQGSCGALECITGTATPLDTNIDNPNLPACNEANSVTASWLSQNGISYYIFVHGHAPNSMGNFLLTPTTFELISSNEFCPQALAVETDGSRVQGSTEDAIFPSVHSSFCGVEVNSPGIWYKFDGSQYPMDIAACSSDDGFDVSVSIFSGTCDNLTCVTGATFQELCASANSGRFLQESSSFSFLSKKGETYYIFVHGQENVGDFELYVTEDDSISDPSLVANVDLPFGTDLYRWTPLDQPVTVNTDYSTLSVLVGSSVTGAEVNLAGSSISYVPKRGWEGVDKLVIKGCRSEECHQFTVTIRVMGSQDDIAESPGVSGGAAGDNGSQAARGGDEDSGNKKLWWLLLLLLIPLCCCLVFFLRRRNRDDDGEDLGDGTRDKFMDEPEGYGDLEDPDDSDEEDDEAEDDNDEEEGEEEDDGDSGEEEDEESNDDGLDFESDDEDSQGVAPPSGRMA